MKTKDLRIQFLRELLQTKKIRNQEEFLQELQEAGFSVTQATLSRDLQNLQVNKVADGIHGSYYTLPQHGTTHDPANSYIQDIKRGLLSLEVSGNLMVLKTRLGHANTVAAALDILSPPEILGSIAGDDTILLVLQEGCTKKKALAALEDLLPPEYQQGA